MALASHDFEITTLTDQHLDDVLVVLGEGLGDGFNREWFYWKHRLGPWGASPGWVATDDEGIAAVRLFLRWEFRFGRSAITAMRPCDTVTASRARGRGLFRRLTETAMNSVDNQCDLYFNTPNSQSRPGYLKMGFREWAVVRQSAGAVLPRAAALVDDVAEPAAGEGMRTPLTRGFIRWRYEECPRHSYRVAGLASSDVATGIVYRIRSGRLGRLFVVAELWGDDAHKRALLKAVSAREGTPLIWLADTETRAAGVSLARGSTIVTHRPVGSGSVPPPNLSIGDIEDVL